ncbi:MAG: UDP-N-acetylmuramoyl-L-alanine--D-glutamate ligase [Candidatus Dormibacteraceae bacterium]
MTGAGSQTHAAVVGLGRSGQALARHLAGRGERVTVLDRDWSLAPGVPDLQLPAGVEVRLGEPDAEILDRCQSLFLSPGVPWDCPLAAAARARGIPVSSEMDLFFKLCPAPIVGVTGTNGKTTTTAMIGAVLGAGDRPVLVGGNIGQSVLDRLDQISPSHWVVLELSSFQLESCERPHARIGVVLNVTPDHLDRHHDMERYIAAKRRLIESLEEDDQAVLNGEDAVCRAFASASPAPVTWFDQHQPPPRCRLPGRHNRLNALAAAAVGRLAGLADPQIDSALESFEGVEHRLELAGDGDGVRWYNDSKATNPDASMVALDAFPDDPLVLIAGGRGAGSELTDWIRAVKARTAAVVLIGESAEEVARLLEDHPHQQVRTLREAVLVAADLVPKPGVVLFSPAFKSFDMFADYEDRGRQFKSAVQEVRG